MYVCVLSRVDSALYECYINGLIIILVPRPYEIHTVSILVNRKERSKAVNPSNRVPCSEA